MKIVLISNGDIPPDKYGGTQRVVWWLAKGLLEIKQNVVIINDGNCRLNHDNLEVIKTDKKINKLRKKNKEQEIYKYIPDDTDIVHLHFNPKKEPDFPYLITFHWLGKAEADFNETIYPNTIFASKRHAEVNGREDFVYHGLDPDDFKFSINKKSNFLFMSKVSYTPKNVKLAKKLAKDMKFKLDIAGGWWFSFSKYIKYHGMVGGKKKKNLLAKSKAMIFPTQIEEPFGLVTIESLVSGTPVIASEYGAMNEIIKPEVGFTCSNYSEYKNAIKNIDEIDPINCRKRVEKKFNNLEMAKNYFNYYKKVVKKGKI